MKSADFDRAVTATLDAVKDAAVAEVLAADLADARARAGLASPPDLEAIARSSLCPELEPQRDHSADRAQLADLVNGLERLHEA